MGTTMFKLLCALAAVAVALGLEDPSKECHDVHEQEHGILSGSYHCWHLVPDSATAGNIGLKFAKFNFGEGQRLVMYKGASKNDNDKIAEFNQFVSPPKAFVTNEKEITIVFRTAGPVPKVGGDFQMEYFRQ